MVRWSQLGKFVLFSVRRGDLTCSVSRGNPREGSRQPMAAGNGLQAVRLYNPATQTVYENVERIHLTSSRWYPSTTRLTDGSLLILGGMLAGGFNNVASTDNPTFECVRRSLNSSSLADALL